MGNIASTVCRPRSVSQLEILRHLNDINNELFGGTFVISAQHGGVTVECDDLDFEYWPESARTWGGKHPHHGQFGFWARMTFDAHLASRIGNCLMKDEGISETWKPDPGKYPTFQSWMKSSASHMFEPPLFYETVDKFPRRREIARQLWRIETSLIPSKLRSFVGPLDEEWIEKLGGIEVGL